ncbi:MAG TPA: hypothetical protein VG841_06160 [Caulobacterales bacterium]|nr:hypothetical protein [Caulobacterales bacterium]
MSAFPPVEELVPHAGGMLLIDRIIAQEGETVRGEVEISPQSLFFEAGRGVPGYVGFELMAQTISAYDGLKRRRNGKPPKIGFLVGCRSYRCVKPFFAAGEKLVIEVTSLLGEEGMASFDCKISSPDGAEMAKAVINVYRPPDDEAFVSGA